MKSQPIWLYVSQEKIYPRATSGLFAKWRWAMVIVTQWVFYGLPWINLHDRQAVLFNLEARRFYVFNLVLYPQDFIFLTMLLVICALSLFAVTAVAGRVWCGYACPQTVYSKIFLWIEHHIEGDRHHRIKLDKQPWSLFKAQRKVLKHTLWLALSIFTGFTFVGYFIPIRELYFDISTGALGAWGLFWIAFYSFATYGNAGFMREQVCKYMCPYARFQSSMFDKDTLIVAYDQRRGEPRGARSKQADLKALAIGDCVDCTLCVQVCPTGIDIRKGLQYECIGCAACIDACDSIMDKMGYPKGLVHYSAQSLKKAFRGRVIVYAGLIGIVATALFTGLALREPIRADVIRDRGSLAREVENGFIENTYRVQLMNTTEQPQEVFISTEPDSGVEVTSKTLIALGAAQGLWVPVSLVVAPGRLKPGSNPIYINFSHHQRSVKEKTMFYVPRNAGN
jgi:cytochrome c oxidase accessory protein FixG